MNEFDLDKAIAELNELRAKTLKVDGSPRKDATDEAIKQIAELEAAIEASGEEEPAPQADEQEQEEAAQADEAGDDLVEMVATLSDKVDMAMALSEKIEEIERRFAGLDLMLAKRGIATKPSRFMQSQMKTKKKG